MRATPNSTKQPSDNVAHPDREQWMAYLYHEVDPSTRSGLEQHLAGCPACTSQVATWRTTMGQLEAWGLPAHEAEPATFRIPFPALKWAAAALILVGLGLFLGRMSSPPPDLAALRQEIAQQVRQELDAHYQAQLHQASATVLAAAQAQTRQYLLSYAREDQAQRLAERQTLLSSWRELDAQRQTEILGLRRDLETVAVFTDAGLRQAEQQLVSLAQTKPSPEK